MNAKRKKAQDHIINHFNHLDKSKTNGDRYKKMFDQMSDKQFDTFMKDLRSGKRKLIMYVPNMANKIRMSNIKDACERLGIPITDKIIRKDPITGIKYTTNQEYPILNVPVRRVKQFLMEKISVPESDKKTDLLTGQVIKPDKGSSISLIEMKTIENKGLTKSIVELCKYRGGDVHGYAEWKSSLENKGYVNLSELDADSTPRSVTIAGVYLKGMHIDNNLADTKD